MKLFITIKLFNKNNILNEIERKLVVSEMKNAIANKIYNKNSEQKLGY